MDKIVEEIFDELLIEAETGIKYNNINIKFHTLEKYSINSTFNDSVPILVIKNKKELVNKLKQYVELVIEVKKLEINKINVKKCISLLLANACYEDFSNPSKFIDNHIGFYLNNDFMSNSKKIGSITMKRVTQTIYKETPYAFKAIINGPEKYYLPNVNYGISGSACYIYSIEQTTHNEVNEYNDNLEKKYDMNLLAISLLIKELYNYGICKIKVVSCLPMRLGNEEHAKIEELLDDFTCLNYMFDNIVVSSNPFEKDEYMNININDFNQDNKSNLSDILTRDSELYVEKVI